MKKVTITVPMGGGERWRVTGEVVGLFVVHEMFHHADDWSGPIPMGWSLTHRATGLDVGWYFPRKKPALKAGERLSAIVGADAPTAASATEWMRLNFVAIADAMAGAGDPADFKARPRTRPLPFERDERHIRRFAP